MKLISYDPLHKQAFYDLNIEWLETYFYVEDFDREVLSNPEHYILKTGGQIFFAVSGAQAVGTVALMPHPEGGYELTKMAVLPSQRGQRIGQQLMEHCIAFGKEQGIPQLLLYSNRKLENAIHIYRKYGFEEIEQETDVPYKRSNIKMVLKF